MQFQPFNQQAQSQTSTATYDEGLRSYMLGVYNYMASAILLTGLVAWFIAQASVAPTADGGLALTALGSALLASPLKWVVMLAPLGMVIFLSARLHKMSQTSAQISFWGFATLMGLSLSTIFLAYTGESIARVFFITAGTFGAMSIYGYTTKRDLTGWGSFLFMGVIGIIIASLVNIFFLESSALQMAISVIGVLLFVGLTAYDTQRIKNTYYQIAGHGEAMAKATIMGALSLYLDFINLFIMLIQLFGQNR